MQTSNSQVSKMLGFAVEVYMKISLTLEYNYKKALCVKMKYFFSFSMIRLLILS